MSAIIPGESKKPLELVFIEAVRLGDVTKVQEYLAINTELAVKYNPNTECPLFFPPDSGALKAEPIVVGGSGFPLIDAILSLMDHTNVRRSSEYEWSVLDNTLRWVAAPKILEMLFSNPAVDHQLNTNAKEVGEAITSLFENIFIKFEQKFEPKDTKNMLNRLGRLKEILILLKEKGYKTQNYENKQINVTVRTPGSVSYEGEKVNISIIALLQKYAAGEYGFPSPTEVSGKANKQLQETVRSTLVTLKKEQIKDNIITQAKALLEVLPFSADVIEIITGYAQDPENTLGIQLNATEVEDISGEAIKIARMALNISPEKDTKKVADLQIQGTPILNVYGQQFKDKKDQASEPQPQPKPQTPLPKRTK